MKRIICNTEDKQLVNHVKIIEDGTKLLTCCNDGYIRIYDLNTLDIIQLFKASSCVNHAEMGNNLLGAVGDFEEVILFDRRTSEIVMNLEGHTDFGFSVKFKDDNILGTGNQDHMCKLWDIRRGECYKSLFGYFEAIGEIEFIDKNQLLFSENMDYMHIYDCEKDTIQSVTYFAYSSGFCYDRRMGKIYQGLFEYSNFGIMVYEKIRNNVFCLNNLIY